MLTKLRAVGRCNHQRVQACHSSSNQGHGRRAVLGLGAAGVTTALLAARQQQAKAFTLPIPSLDGGGEARSGKVHFTDEEWRARLAPDAYRVLRQAATELPGSSPLNNEKRVGTFVCGGCSAPLFQSSTKFNSGTGWPSYYAAIPGAVDESTDMSIPFMPRTEVRCHTCQGHLGHVFNDGYGTPTGLRYCMNGAALKFVPDDTAPKA